jgi:hypothetical protein
MIGKHVTVNAFNDQYSGEIYKIVKGETWTHILFGEFNDYQ